MNNTSQYFWVENVTAISEPYYIQMGYKLFDWQLNNPHHQNLIQQKNPPNSHIQIMLSYYHLFSLSAHWNITEKKKKTKLWRDKGVSGKASKPSAVKSLTSCRTMAHVLLAGYNRAWPGPLTAQSASREAQGPDRLETG